LSFSGPDLSSLLKRRAPRMSIANIATGVVVDAQFNPAEIRESVEAVYAEIAIVGLSHQPQQYQHTSNHKFDFELGFRVYDDEGNKLASNDYARRFLLSMLYSARGGGDVVGGAPPRALFVWPGWISVTSVIKKLDFTHTFFGVEPGIPYHFGVKINIDEIRDVRLYSEDVLAKGTQR
jgi:hypothetical protein